MIQAFETSIADILKTRNRRDDLPLIHKTIGDFHLPTGQLVAFNPLLLSPRHEPFSLQLPCGRFPIFVSLASIAECEFVIHATIQFSDSSPVRWELMTIDDQDRKEAGSDERFGFPMHTETGCFFDFSITRAPDVINHMWETIVASHATKMANLEFIPQWGFEVQFGPANLIAFPMGLRNGIFETFAAFDSEGRVCAVVTDF